ncbi:hypothetical protein [Roseateles sp.]|uniref:hypothetical protein n=1 Tax=Roseateles sp. TaxID=1971397 RepID=UPI003BA608A8
MRTLIATALLVSTNFISGCAYLTTYNKAIDLDGASVSLDVKQRVVFSQKRQGGATGRPDRIVVCAEPSPDALTVLAVSGGLAVSNGDNVANASAGLAESGAFVGLRTQSIQLLRDAMYRLCEGYAAGAVGDTDFAAMQRRYQSTMMGLIAIEQLTRPVVAGQALLTSAAAGQSGASAGDAAVDKAQARVDAAKAAALTAETEIDKAAARFDKARASLRDSRENLDLETKKKPEDQNATTLATLQEQVTAGTKELQDSQLALADARRRAASADEEVRSAATALRSAQSRVATTASAGGQLGALAESAAKSTEHLTKGVVDIVAEINASYTKDACLALLADLVKSPDALRALTSPSRDPSPGGAGIEVLFRSLTTCERILAAEQARVESLPSRKP